MSVFSKLLRKQAPDLTGKHRAPEGCCAYFVGDIHGHLDPLRRLVNRIAKRAAQDHADLQTTLVFLGDYVDRGPESAGVIDYLLSLDLPDIETVFLGGNHEDAMLDVLQGARDVETMETWFSWGGLVTARSYGVSNMGDMTMHPERVLKRLLSAVPQAHIDFLSNLPDTFRFGDYLAVHAGVRPSVPLEEQTSKDLRWIRKDFLTYRKPFPLKIIHGHSIVDRPQNYSNRIAVDTGVYQDGGHLSAAFLVEDRVEFLSEATIGKP